MRWLSFLQQTLASTASAAAGTAAGGFVVAGTGNPILGAAAGAAASKSTEQLLSEFIPAQQQALDTLLERTRGMEVLLGGIRSDIQTLLDAPWQAALLHIEDAAKHPASADRELQLARDSLYQAWGSSANGVKRALVAQQLSVVYALLGEGADSGDWFLRSYGEADKGAGESAASLIASLESLPHLRVRVKDPLGSPVPAGTVRVVNGVGLLVFDPPFYISAQPFLTALTALSGLAVDLLRLRLTCGSAGMSEPWPSDRNWGGRWNVYGGGDAPVSVRTGSREDKKPVARSTGEPWAQVKAGKEVYTVQGSKELASLPAFALLDSIGLWTFRLSGVPWPKPAQVFISGSSAELGGWAEDRAIPLYLNSRPIYGPFWRWPQRPTGQPDKPWLSQWWSTELQLLSAAESARAARVEYRYFCVPEPGQAPRWEDGPNRVVREWKPGASAGPQAFLEDEWGRR